MPLMVAVMDNALVAVLPRFHSYINVTPQIARKVNKQPVMRAYRVTERAFLVKVIMMPVIKASNKPCQREWMSIQQNACKPLSKMDPFTKSPFIVKCFKVY